MRLSILRGVNFLLEAIDRHADVPGLHMDSFSEKCCTHLNGLLLNSGVGDMNVGKHYRAVNMVFSTMKK